MDSIHELFSTKTGFNELDERIAKNRTPNKIYNTT